MSSVTTATDAVVPRIAWRRATVIGKKRESPRAVTLTVAVPGWQGHRAGQHVDIRLTAEDGYRAQRSYSIGSAPEDGALDLTIERLNDGEVSPYLVDEAREGDEFELRGPLGGWFTWAVEDGGPLLLIGGGSGLVPLMSMLRHRRNSGSDAPARLLVSARSLDELLYRDELEQFGDVERFITLTREQPPGWTGYARRIDPEMLREVAWPAARAFVCGPTNFVEAAAEGLVGIGYPTQRVKTERFGATG